MHLTPANLAYFLMDRSLLGADEIVAGRVSILDASRRNRNFKVIRQGAPGLFVKQMRDMQTDAMLTLKREAACYELARDIPELARIMPRLVRYDERRHWPAGTTVARGAWPQPTPRRFAGRALRLLAR